MKRLIKLSLLVFVLAAIVVGCGQSGGTAGGGAATATKPTTPQGRLVVGVNAMNGNMFTGWDNLVANSNAKDLINGYGTIMYTKDDQFIPDPVVVRNMTTRENADGGKTYTFEINSGLVWNDGRPITAKDYVFGALFDLSFEARELGARRWVGGDVYQGFEEYNSGETKVLTAFRLLGEYSFSVTIAPVDGDGEPTFPFWYEITYAGVGPLPMHIIAPGCDVADTGNGVQMTGPFTTDLLRSTVDNGSTGYRYTPYVSCGPYKFVSYDPTAYIITLETNDRYAGEGPERTKPLIKTLILKQTEQATEIDELRAGTVDLLVQLSGAVSINAGRDVCDTGRASYITYGRNGYGKITFHCDWGPTQFPEVRRAIAYCMNREEFVRQYTGGYGIIVHSRVGNAQWMYRENLAALERNLTVYTVNLAKAREELDAAGFTLNSTGGAYTGTGTRYKRMPDNSLMALRVEWFSPDSNPIGEMLSTFLDANWESVGGEISHDWGDSAAFGNALYGTGKRYNMINGGTGFAVQDSPWYYYVPDPEMFGYYNGNFIIDEPLNRYTQDMKQTTPGDNASYSRSWLNFVTRFNEILPDIPLYSDEYHDFFNAKLKDFSHSAIYPWTSAILDAWVTE
ncbi:MAG: ABC transporter substrate-binding protein [Treponema sp.]|jgi:peptide/nickel transport system substrate-binding protein|nr:ABC transporter substrate-binding protein [Treponema sp.]